MDESNELRRANRGELAAQVIRDSGELRFRATGSSMLPAIRPGDILTIHRRELAAIQPGDIAFFSAYGGIVAHRVISKSQDFLMTQGDSVPSLDPPVTAGNFLGLVHSIERDGKSFAPSRYPSALSTLTATVLQRSDFAMRIWLTVWLRIRSLRNSRNTHLQSVHSIPTASA